MLEHRTAVVEEGLSRLIGQHKGKPRLEAWIASYLEEVQELEDAIFETYTLRQLDNATGARLDIVGNLVGQPRVDGDDDRQRLYVKLRIRANRSRGRASDIIALAGLLFEDLGFEYDEAYPRSMTVEVFGPPDIDHNLAIELMRLGKTAGVALNLIYSDESLDDSLYTAGGVSPPLEVDDTRRGFADTAESVGGYAAGVV